MRFSKIWPFLLIPVFIGGVGFFAVRTFVNSGPAAIAAMDPSDLALKAKLDTLRKGMSPSEVFQILGEPDETGPFGLRPKWQVGVNPMNAVVVYFVPEGARTVRWLNLGRFMYERNL